MTMVATGSRSSTDRSSRRTTLLIGLGILAALVVISVLNRDSASFADDSLSLHAVDTYS